MHPFMRAATLSLFIWTSSVYADSCENVQLDFIVLKGDIVAKNIEDDVRKNLEVSWSCGREHGNIGIGYNLNSR